MSDIPTQHHISILCQVLGQEKFRVRFHKVNYRTQTLTLNLVKPPPERYSDLVETISEYGYWVRSLEVTSYDITVDCATSDVYRIWQMASKV